MKIHYKQRALLLLCSAFIFLSFIPNEKGNPRDNLSPVQEDYELIGVRAIDIHGNIHRIGIENKKAFPIALVFIDVECPISRRFIPKLNSLYDEAESLGVKFYGVISNPYVNWKEALEFSTSYGIEFPILYDANGDLAERLGPSVVPQCFVLDIYDRMVYYGRINDQYAAIGKYSPKARHEDLALALKTVAEGGKMPYLTRDAKGCIFESWDNQNRKISFNKDIEPIIRANCSSCHRPGGIGPFSLLTYEEVAQRGRMVDYVTEGRIMPIWKAEKGHGKFANEHRLSDYQIQLVHKWVGNGAVEGEAKDLMPSPTLAGEEWTLGKPDLILKMEPYQLPAEGEDEYRVLVMKNAIPKGKVIRAIDFKAGDPSVVHHSTIFIDYSKNLRKYDAEDPRPGYNAFEKGGTMEFGSAITIGNWAPGIGPYMYPEKVGFYVEQNADIAFENHYHLSGKATTDQSYVGIYFANELPDKYITGSILGTQRLLIPAKDTAFTQTVWAYVPTDIELYDLTPHMHYIGKEVDVKLHYPNGKIRSLLTIKDWDLRWQSVYTLRELLPIPKGSIIEACFTYDNSDNNHDNPYYPAQEMYWGWGSNDEMCELYLSYVPKNDKDYGKMLSASFASFEHSYPATERIGVNEGNLPDIFSEYSKADIWSKEGEKLLISILESALSDKLLQMMERKTSAYRQDLVFQVNYAQLLMWDALYSMEESKIASAGEKAAKILEKVLEKDESQWNSVISYAKLLLDSGSPQYAKEGAKVLAEFIPYQETLAQEEKFAKPYWFLGRYYFSLREDAAAKAMLTRGLHLFPGQIDLTQELASEGRIVKKTLK